MTIEHPFQPSRLFEHDQFLRRLARDLVGDSHLAEDLLQRTYLYALQRPPSARIVPRSWLRKVMRHLAIDTFKSDRRRLEREALVARAEAMSEADEMEERRRLEAQVVSALERLAEPYRSTIVLRYLEGLGPRAIAARQQCPVETVKTRLRRGMARLRSDLDDAFDGDTRRWTLALVALVHSRPQRRLAPASAMGLAGIAAVGAAVVAVAAMDRPRPEQSVEEIATSPGAEVSSVDLTTPAALPIRAATPPRALDTPPVEPETTNCRVVDEWGASVPNARVAFLGDGEATPVATATTATDGYARFESVLGPGNLVASGTVWTTFLAGRIGGYRPLDPPVVIVGPTDSIAGVVVDSAGAGVAGVRISVVPQPGFDERLRDLPHTRRRSELSTVTAADGSFELPRVPRLETADLRFAHPDHRTRFHGVAELCGRHTRIDIESEGKRRESRPERGNSWVTGTVARPDGAPVTGARVASGGAVRVTGSDGRFAFPLRTDSESGSLLPLPSERSVVVSAGLPGCAPVWRRLALPNGEEEDPISIELVLEPPRDPIWGVVVDGLGRPLGGIEVWLYDPTAETLIGRGTLLEDAASASDTRTSASGATWLTCETTDEAGAFRVDGLAARPYRIVARDVASGALTIGGPWWPGSDSVRVELNREAVWKRVSGRVRTAAGEAVRAVTITVLSDVQRPQVDGVEVGVRSILRGEVVPDDHGRFSIEDVPRVGSTLLVEGDGACQRRFDLDAGDGTGDTMDGLDLVVARPAELRVELEDPGFADRLRVFDPATGETPVALSRNRPGAQRPWLTDCHRMISDGSARVVVPETARTLVLYSGAEQVRRLEIRPRAGAVLDVDL